MRAIELFAGAGGLGMGVSQAGFKPLEIVEWDKWCCDTINRNRWGRKRPVAAWPEPTQGDIRELDFEEFEGKVDLVSGGPPCQPFSLGGKHGAHTDHRDMWSEAVRVVRETKPRAFIFENVKGLTRASFATYFSYINLQLHYPEVERGMEESWTDHLARLEQHHTSDSESGLHYKVVVQVLNAANYGVPQRRERVVFVGFRADTGIRWSFPEKTHSLEALLWEQVRSGEYWDRHRVAKLHRDMDCRLFGKGMKLVDAPKESPWRTVRDAIHDLPEPTDFVGSKVLNHRYQPGARSYPGHTGSPMDGPAKTLKAGVHGVPGGENMLARVDGTVRYFTVRESARLQTFPDDYELHGSWTEAMRQLGNAVPVELARVIASDVANQLRKAA
ncbi:MAG TPA: DNA cytosine methyltransferase [Allosphingosinicella sp.]|nr:DNA cytosine methyltransferase [Allosphingosinicella sp.]